MRAHQLASLLGLLVAAPALAQSTLPALVVELLPPGVKHTQHMLPPVHQPAPATGSVKIQGASPVNYGPGRIADFATLELDFQSFDPNDMIGKMSFEAGKPNLDYQFEQMREAMPPPGREGKDVVHPPEPFATGSVKGACQRRDYVRAERTGPNPPTHAETYFDCIYAGVSGSSHYTLSLTNVPVQRATAEAWHAHIAGRLKGVTVGRVAAGK